MTDLAALTTSQLRDSYQATRSLQYNASRMNSAAGVFAMETELDAIYAEADARGICLTRPELDAKPVERPSDLIDDGYGLRARGGLVYFG